MSTHFLFYIKSFESDAKISCVKLAGDSIVVGTNMGKVHVYDKTTMKENADTYKPHKRTVVDIWVADKKAILTCSNDRTVFLKFYDDEIEDQELPIGFTTPPKEDKKAVP